MTRPTYSFNRALPVCVPGEAITLSATVMVYDPALDTYVPSDCHGTDFVWGRLPYLGNNAASITCETGLVTGLPYSGAIGQELFGAYLREKPWIWGQNMTDVPSRGLHGRVCVG